MADDAWTTDESDGEEDYDQAPRVSRLQCKAAAFDCLMALGELYESQSWPTPMVSYVCDMFLQCGNQSTMNRARVAVTSLIASKVVEGTVATTDWGKQSRTIPPAPHAAAKAQTKKSDKAKKPEETKKPQQPAPKKPNKKPVVEEEDGTSSLDDMPDLVSLPDSDTDDDEGQSQADTSDMLQCTMCHNYLPKESFTKKQRKKAKAKRKCSTCLSAQEGSVESSTTGAAPAPAETTRPPPPASASSAAAAASATISSESTLVPCFSCQLPFPPQHYSKSQRGKGAQRRCPNCVATGKKEGGGPKEDPVKLAEKHRLSGNEAYRAGDFETAASYYSDAIELMPKVGVYWRNRAASRFMQSRYGDAYIDAIQAVRLEPNDGLHHMRLGKCYIAMGALKLAQDAFESALELGVTAKAKEALKSVEKIMKSETMLIEAVLDGKDEKDVDSAYQECIKKCRESTEGCIPVGVNMIGVLLDIIANPNDFSHSEELDRLEMLRPHNSMAGVDFDASIDFIYGLCFYYHGEPETAIKYFIMALHKQPEYTLCETAKNKAEAIGKFKSKGAQHYRMKKYTEALEAYTAALAVDTHNDAVNARLHCNCGLCLANIGKHKQAIESYGKALAINDQYAKAFINRGKMHLELEDFDAALRDIEYGHDLLEENHDPSVCALLQRAQALREQSKSGIMSYYKLLGIPASATAQQIKKAYRVCAKLHHPDRHQDPKKKAQGEVLFKKIGEAYEVLSDPAKRETYDRGELHLDKKYGSGSAQGPQVNMDDLMAYIFMSRFGGMPFFGEGGPFGGAGFHDGYDDYDNDDDEEYYDERDSYY